ncbi:hypothetical protein amb3160 [Paramagnetospirillum magneticum AMB-1]|uniref:Uncharacterized protein n=1 Tax=Paramagnetospirillum magneticum (strain ATCC 700264 / AMB-1) TaxID=342108 RepID=Q2W2G1_PARM1|nr:hypothetical protein amb3160 [Paramagnetospirillum magneticum AMB-1]
MTPPLSHQAFQLPSMIPLVDLWNCPPFQPFRNFRNLHHRGVLIDFPLHPALAEDCLGLNPAVSQRCLQPFQALHFGQFDQPRIGPFNKAEITQGL